MAKADDHRRGIENAAIHAELAPSDFIRANCEYPLIWMRARRRISFCTDRQSCSTRKPQDIAGTAAGRRDQILWRWLRK